MEQSSADKDLLHALHLVPNPKPSTEATSEPTPSTVNGEYLDMEGVVLVTAFVCTVLIIVVTHNK